MLLQKRGAEAGKSNESSWWRKRAVEAEGIAYAASIVNIWLCCKSKGQEQCHFSPSCSLTPNTEVFFQNKQYHPNGLTDSDVHTVHKLKRSKAKQKVFVFISVTHQCVEERAAVNAIHVVGILAGLRSSFGYCHEASLHSMLMLAPSYVDNVQAVQ